MKNSWTGGQYSIFRALLALFLFAYLLSLILRGSDLSIPVILLLAIGTGALCILFGIGLYDRVAALFLFCLGVGLLAWNHHATLGVILLGWLLLAHQFVPPAPYGSWAARGRIDPGDGWRMPLALFGAAWITLTLSYFYTAYIMLVRAEFLHLEWTLGLLMLQLFAFNPGWIPPLPAGTERIFYDGHCGLCQRSVRLILAEDTTGAAFRFAPLQGETFQSTVPPKERDALPLSLVVQTEKGTLLTRSAGVLHIMRRLGGVWRLLAGLLFLIPVPLRNRLYDGVARIRHRLFARPPEMCPLMSPQLRARFDP
jgi:predicted DCC family thiol-disulfide oxidoreductase YuxK